MKKLIATLLSLLFIIFFGAAAATAQTWAVAVNAADAVELGTIGVEGSAAVGQHWSIHANAKVNPWTFGRRDTSADNNGLFQSPNPTHKQDSMRVYAAGVRS